MSAAHQLHLLDWQPTSSRYDDAPPPRDWDRDARAYFAEHEEVLRYFEAAALEELSEGRNYVSAKLVWERCRQFFGPRGYALNNNYTAEAARWWRARNPEHAGKMRTRVKA